jgi:hypothetical protein
VRALEYWIQRADFSAVDHKAADAADGVRAFMTHNWPAELNYFSEREESGSDYCPPGIGFVDPSGPILHICPASDGRAMVHYHAESTRKVLGFIPTPQATTLTKQGVHRSSVVELIQWFFEGRHDWILRTLAAA